MGNDEKDLEYMLRPLYNISIETNSKKRRTEMQGQMPRTDRLSKSSLVRNEPGYGGQHKQRAALLACRPKAKALTTGAPPAIWAATVPTQRP
jgi:hypothetical protein